MKIVSPSQGQAGRAGHEWVWAAHEHKHAAYCVIYVGELLCYISNRKIMVKHTQKRYLIRPTNSFTVLTQSIHPLIHIPTLTHQHTHLTTLTHSLIHSLTHSLTQSINQSAAYPLTRSMSCVTTHSRTR